MGWSSRRHRHSSSKLLKANKRHNGDAKEIFHNRGGVYANARELHLDDRPGPRSYGASQRWSGSTRHRMIRHPNRYRGFVRLTSSRNVIFADSELAWFTSASFQLGTGDSKLILSM